MFCLKVWKKSLTNSHNMPTHIAIVMDGNGRWAKKRGLKRKEGHKQGAKTTRSITEHCAKIGIKYLTAYAFSTENWNRPKVEVEFLMKLLQKYLKQELETYLSNNIIFDTIGDITVLSKTLQKLIKDTKAKTKNNTGLTQILALNYGSHDEIVRAANKLQKNNSKITIKSIKNHLDTSRFPDVDIFLRTGGEKRVSNFLLWQIAYTEIFFVDEFWPDFDEKQLDAIISQFYNRHRRYGAL